MTCGSSFQNCWEAKTDPDMKASTSNLLAKLTIPSNLAIGKSILTILSASLSAISKKKKNIISILKVMVGSHRGIPTRKAKRSEPIIQDLFYRTHFFHKPSSLITRLRRLLQELWRYSPRNHWMFQRRMSF